jgi:hypothetical protein
MNDIQIYSDGVGVESFFIKAIDPSGDRGLWLKFTFLKSASGITFKVWSIFFDRKNFYVDSEVYSIDKVVIDKNTINWPDGYINYKSGSAGVTSGSAWNLSWNVIDSKPIKLLPNFLYSNVIPITKLITPYPRILVSGRFTFPGYRFSNYNENLLGMQGHNWGPKHSREYVWMFANTELFSVEGFSTKIYPFSFTSICVRYDSEDYIFSDILSPLKISSRYNSNDFEWIASASKIGRKVRISGIGNKSRSVALTYKNPDGSSMLCSNDNMAGIYVNLKTRKGDNIDCAVGAALEFLTKE